MENNKIAVGLDIGTTKIVAMIGRKNEYDKIEVVGTGKAKSLGVKRGVVSNITQTIQSIQQAVDEAESVKNSVVRTIPDLQAHASFFANMQLPEQRKFRPKAGIGLVSTINVISQSTQGGNPATT